MVSAQLSKTNKGVDDENHNPVILPEGVLHPIQGGMKWIFNFSSLLFNSWAEYKCVLL
jgi:hypothetical protein